MDTVADNIWRLRNQMGISAAKLGKSIGKSYGAIYRLENRQKAPTVVEVEQLAEALGVSAAELMGIKDA